MNVNVKATNIKLTDSINEYLEKRVKAFDKLIDSNDTSAMCDVEVGKTSDKHKSGELFRAEFNIHIAGRDFRAVSEKESLFDAIDDAKIQMLKELRRNKEKKQKSIRAGGAKIKDIMRGFRN